MKENPRQKTELVRVFYMLENHANDPSGLSKAALSNITLDTDPIARALISQVGATEDTMTDNTYLLAVLIGMVWILRFVPGASARYEKGVDGAAEGWYGYARWQWFSAYTMLKWTIEHHNSHQNQFPAQPGSRVTGKALILASLPESVTGQNQLRI